MTYQAACELAASGRGFWVQGDCVFIEPANSIGVALTAYRDRMSLGGIGISTSMPDGLRAAKLVDENFRLRTALRNLLAAVSDPWDEGDAETAARAILGESEGPEP